MTDTTKLLCALSLLGLGLTACGASPAPPATTTQAPKAESAPSTKERGFAEPPPPPAATGTAAPTGRAPQTGHVPGMPGRTDDLTYPDAVQQFERQARELSLSLSQCTEACRALSSLERAARRICTVGEDVTRCEDAKARLREARTRVREKCKECPGGASTDPNAPL